MRRLRTVLTREELGALPKTIDAFDRVTLPFEQRCRSRLRARLDGGEEVGLVLPRGTILRGGDVLRGEAGELVEVVAAPEPVSVVASDDVRLLCRACYHLGNRHVPLQVERGWVGYLQDPVLDEMVREMGLAVQVHHQAFEPEGGAYGGHHHHPGHSAGSPHEHERREGQGGR